MDRVIAVGGVIVTAAMIFAQAIAQVIDFTVYDLRIGALNSDVHSSIFGVMSLVANGAMATAAGFRAMHWKGARNGSSWAALAAALVVVRAAIPGSALALLILWGSSS